MVLVFLLSIDICIGQKVFTGLLELALEALFSQLHGNLLSCDISSAQVAY
jgi:hypothetical protein